MGRDCLFLLFFSFVGHDRAEQISMYDDSGMYLGFPQSLLPNTWTVSRVGHTIFLSIPFPFIFIPPFDGI
jgi:hypothetical protein